MNELSTTKKTRRTVQNVRRAGLEIIDLRREGVWREIIARPSATGS